MIKAYQIVLSPFKAPCCRFTPSCSQYARQAFLLHGTLKGAMLTAKRISKCHPWGPSGYDPVPPKRKN
ncbi:MAG: membrane protein insertion efficiency factor YidD [Lactobacillales bacterium]|nr:membrane protein insertion efficiency factor YidD [Lactobacillales bacterium]